MLPVLLKLPIRVHLSFFIVQNEFIEPSNISRCWFKESIYFATLYFFKKQFLSRVLSTNENRHICKVYPANGMLTNK